MEKYTSKTKRNECKNEKCSNQRQHGSSRCAKCAKNSPTQSNGEVEGEK